jgi:phosphoenolpyruvate phosphomutase
MKSLILAAGRGSRIPEISKTKPKCLIKIKDKTILGRQIHLMRKNNITEIGIVRGFKKNKIKFKKIKYFYNRNYETNEQLDSLMIAKIFLNSDVIVTFSDIIYDEQILNSLIHNQDNFSVAVDPNWKKRYVDRIDHSYSQADKVFLRNGKVIEIGKNISLKKANAEFLGMFKISKSFCKIFLNQYSLFRKKTNTLQIHHFIQYLIKKKISVNACCVTGKYMEIDTFNDLKIAKKIFK